MEATEKANNVWTAPHNLKIWQASAAFTINFQLRSAPYELVISSYGESNVQVQFPEKDSRAVLLSVPVYYTNELLIFLIALILPNFSAASPTIRKHTVR